MDFKVSIGWFSLLMAAACGMVALFAVYAVATAPDATTTGPSDLTLPIAMLFLKPIAFATMAAGAVGLFWPSDTDVEGHHKRCRTSLIIGALAVAASFYFGPTF